MVVKSILTCAAIGMMIALFFFIRSMTTIGDHFGEGFGLGVIFMAALMGLAYKVAPRRFYWDEDKAL
jgi:hypothetical protein